MTALKHASADTPAFRAWLSDVLVEICAVDNTPNAEVAKAAANEARVFEILEREFGSLGFQGARLRRVPVNPAIEAHPFFSHLYYTRTPEQPDGLGVAECYQGRGNLLFEVDGEGRGPGGTSLALNAHIDTVAPHLPPRVEGDLVFGRGACDDKGNVVAMLGALRLVAEQLKADGKRRPNRDLTAMIVIEEETGGNGSLSLALDRQLKQRYDSLLVLECASNGIYPGNRGCVWFKVQGRLEGVNLFEAALYAIEELEAEGRAMRAESAHPLFPHRPVQTCHGIIGTCGEHPSRVNGDVSFEIVLDPRGAHLHPSAAGAPTGGELPGDSGRHRQAPAVINSPPWPATAGGGRGRVEAADQQQHAASDAPGRQNHGQAAACPCHPEEAAQVESLIRDCLEDGLRQYTGVYGDKTQVTDPGTGKPKVDHHYDFERTARGVRIRVWGATGHMGSVLELDGAITKMAAMGRALLRSRAAIQAAAGAAMHLRLVGWPDPSQLLMEGGQGFLPTHQMSDVQARITAAVLAGVRRYLAGLGRHDDPSGFVRVSFEKLHNAAFSGDPDSPEMRDAIAAAREVGLWNEGPVRGWDVSCDARIFASEYPGLPVITTGPGALRYAHSDSEQINIGDMARACVFLAEYILKRIGN